MRGSRPRCEAVFSYASPEDGPLRRRVIQAVERFTGRARLERMYVEHRAGLRPDDNVWAVTMLGMGLDILCDPGRLAAVPAEGPLVVVANHPFGFIDGLAICYLVSTVRPGFKVLINKAMTRIPEVADFMLPIDFAGTRAAAAANARSRAQARALLKAGGCLIVFPSAAVSTAPHPFAPAVDPEWQPFAGRLIQQGRAAVLPIFVEGENSRLFQLASQVSLTLRLSLLMWELTRRMGTTVSLRIGPVIPFEALPAADGPASLIAALRRLTYALAEGDAPAVRLAIDRRAAPPPAIRAGSAA